MILVCLSDRVLQYCFNQFCEHPLLWLFRQVLCMEPKTRKNSRCSLMTSTCLYLMITRCRDVTRSVTHKWKCILLQVTIWSENLWSTILNTYEYIEKVWILSFKFYFNFLLINFNFCSCCDNCWMTRSCVSYRSHLRWRLWRDWASSLLCPCLSKPASAAVSCQTGYWSVNTVILSQTGFLSVNTVILSQTGYLIVS